MCADHHERGPGAQPGEGGLTRGRRGSRRWRPAQLCRRARSHFFEVANFSGVPGRWRAALADPHKKYGPLFALAEAFPRWHPVKLRPARRTPHRPAFRLTGRALHIAGGRGGTGATEIDRR